MNKAADFRASGGIYEDLFVQSRARQTIPTVDDDSRGEDLARPVQVQWYFPHMALCVALEFWTGLLPSILPSFSPELYFFCGISKHQMLRWIEDGWSCRVASGLIVRTRTRLDSRISPSRWLLGGNIGWRRECLCSLRRFLFGFSFGRSTSRHVGMLDHQLVDLLTLARFFFCISWTTGVYLGITHTLDISALRYAA